MNTTDRKAVESERRFYMAKMLPDMHNRLLLRLHEVLAQMRGPKSVFGQDFGFSHGSDNHSHSPNIEDDGYLPVVASNGKINGYLIMNGLEIAKTELKIKMLKFRKGEEFRVEILPIRPMPMQQLEDAYLCLELADRTLRGIEFNANANNDSGGSRDGNRYRHGVLSPPPLRALTALNAVDNNDSNSNPTSVITISPTPSSLEPIRVQAQSAVGREGEGEGEGKFDLVDKENLNDVSVSTAIAIFSEVLGNMTDTIAHLRRRVVHSFPEARAFRRREIFPEMPDDLHVDFSISSSDIVVSVFALKAVKHEESHDVLTDSQIFDDEQFKRALGGALSGGLYIDAMGMPIRMETPSPTPSSSLSTSRNINQSDKSSYGGGGGGSGSGKRSNPKMRLTRSDTDGNLLKLSSSVSEGLARLVSSDKNSGHGKAGNDPSGGNARWWSDEVHPSHHPMGLGAGDEEPVYDPSALIGEVVDFGGKTVKVLEVAEATYPLPQIQSCIRSLEEAVHIARRLIDQLSLFQRV